MSRVITSSGSYGRRHPADLRRRELISALVAAAGDALPGLIVTPVNIVKSYQNDEYEIHIVVFDQQKPCWWVARICPFVENLQTDVLLPTHALRRTQYLTTDIAEISESGVALPQDKLEEIVLEQVPKVVTFVSNPQPDWYESVKEMEGSLAVLESFRQPDGNTLLRLNGELPRSRGVLLDVFVRIPHAPGVFRSTGNAEWNASGIQLGYDGETVRFKAKVVGNEVLLSLEQKLIASDSIELWQVTNDYYDLRISGAQDD